MVAAGQIAEIKGDAVHAALLRILSHVAVAVQIDLRDIRKALLRQQRAGGIHRCLLDIEGEHLSLLPHQLAQKGGVVPAAGGGVDAQVPRLDVLGDDFMGNPQCVQSHHLFYSSLLASSLISSIASLPLRCSTVISSIHSGFQSCSMARWRLSSLSCGA